MLIELIDRVILLLDRRQRRKEKILEDVITPIFSALAVVHVDYLQMLETARGEIEDFAKWRAQRTTEQTQLRPGSNGDSWSVPEDEGFEVVARMSDIAQRIEQRRLKLEPDRVRLRRMIAAALNASASHDEDAHEFLDVAADYTPKSDFVTKAAQGEYSTTATMWLAHVMRDLIDEYHEPARGQYSKGFHVLYGIKSTLRELDRILEHVRSRWGQVCEQYEEVKLTLRSGA